MKQKLICKSIAIMVALTMSFSCDEWKEDVELDDSNLSKNLSELIAQNQEISVFAEILQLTGYDKLLQEEQSFTVFAPENGVLNQMDLSDVEGLTEWVENYIACLSYYTNALGDFTTNGEQLSKIEMINGKSVPVNPSLVVKTNLACANGVLHIINTAFDQRKNIWEYLLEQEGYEQVRFIQTFEIEEMDKERSVQTGVDENGQPVYDTVWVSKNTFLETYPLDNERQLFTVVLLEQNAIDVLKTKYNKYMRRKNAEDQDREVLYQLSSDLILKETVFSNAGRYPSFEDVLVDIDPADITESYQASNGMVYKLSAADIKIFENKIKTQIIEGEDYVDRWDGENAWTVRYRSWASGGQDVVLQGRTRQSFEWDEYFPENDSTVHRTTTPSPFTCEKSLYSKTNNAYVKYEPIMYSCDYEIFWLTYDDYNHGFTVPETGLTPGVTMPMKLEQKLLISFPEEPVLMRESDAKISNNFTSYSLMAGVAISGVREETQLVRYRQNISNVNNVGLYMLDVISDGEDIYGSGGILKCPAQGKATFFVANTVRGLNADAGLIFLDYIRLVPKVDPND